MFSKNKITRIVSISAAAMCMLSAIKMSPINVDDAAAVGSLTAFEITEEMKIGWNVGNSLDAYVSKNNTPVASAGLESETSWGNPATTQEMINAIKAKGFNTVRVPVSWFQHLDSENNIDPAWLARVKEVVDYAYNNDMYVILNIHHEEGWINRSDLGTAYDEIKPRFIKLWTQIATTFADYDQRLVFEAMNEPRATGTDHEWYGPLQSECDTINKLNADFVELIRSIDSPYKDTRLLMCPSYCASSDTSIMTKTIIPDDDYVAASVHAYTPYNFTMNAEITDHSTFTASYANEFQNVFDGIRKTFSDKDIPVVIGEFSSSNFDNEAARCDWAETYLTTAKKYGFPCILWDNNVEKNGGGEAHGYLNRRNCTWYEPSESVVDTMMTVMNDSSVVWGSERKSPVISHDDISTGTVIITGPKELDASVKDGNCVAGNATWSLLDGGDVAVKYTGETPVIAVVDADWQNWTEIKPYDVDEEKGIAYYSSQHIANAWASGDPTEIQHLFVRTNSVTNVELVAVIGGGEVVDPPEDNTKKYKLDLSGATSDQTLVVTFKGAAGSAINGCVGYMGDEWTNIEYSGKIGSDGTFVVEIPMSDFPAGTTSAEAQIWWCDDENGEMSGYEFVGAGVTTTTTVTTTAPEETTTTTVVIIDDAVYGDADLDGKVGISDVVKVMMYVANKEVNPLTDEQLNNSDVNNRGDGVFISDALSIQKKVAQIIDVLPESVMS